MDGGGKALDPSEVFAADIPPTILEIDEARRLLAHSVLVGSAGYVLPPVDREPRPASVSCRRSSDRVDPMITGRMTAVPRRQQTLPRVNLGIDC